MDRPARTFVLPVPLSRMLTAYTLIRKSGPDIGTKIFIPVTNAIEALNSKIRRAARTRGHFPSDDAAAKLIYLALNATSTEWKRSVREWHAVRSQFTIMFEDRFPMA